MLEVKYSHLTALVCIAGAAAYYYLTKPRHTYPTVSSGLPILGVLAKWSEDAPSVLQEARAKYGDIFCVNLVFMRLTFILGGEANRFMFHAKDDVLNFQDAASQLLKAAFSSNPFADKEWVPVGMRLITKGFNNLSRLQVYLANILEEADNGFRKYAQLGQIDLFRHIPALTSKIVLRCMIGTEMCEKYGDEIASLIYEIETLIASPILLILPTFPTPHQIRIKRARSRLMSLFDEIIEDRIANPDKWKNNQEYIQLVLNETDTKYKHILPLHLLSIALAAFTNTAGTMAWTIANIAKEERILTKVREELVKNPIHGESEDSAISKISGLTYLDACMKETVRKYSLLILLRQAKCDIEFNGHIIPKGELVSISPLVIHRDSTVFPDPDSYNPDRFIDKELTDKVVKNMEFVQFGYLKHRCLGERFANLVLKTVWYTLFSGYDVTLASELSEADFTKAGGTPFAKNPILMNISVRGS